MPKTVKQLLKDKQDATRRKNYKLLAACCIELAEQYKKSGRLDEAFEEFSQAADLAVDDQVQVADAPSRVTLTLTLG
jgi:hypothetical protein